MSTRTLTHDRTPRHGLPYLFPGQAQKEALLNEALARIDGLLQPTVIAEQDKPPETPQAGDIYLVSAAPVDLWAGEAGNLATWSGAGWLFTRPHPGMRILDNGTGCLAFFDSSDGWTRLPAPPPVVGGEVRDAEARATLAAVIAALRKLGAFPQGPVSSP